MTVGTFLKKYNKNIEQLEKENELLKKVYEEANKSIPYIASLSHYNELYKAIKAYDTLKNGEK
jgi:hypothetical protein